MSNIKFFGHVQVRWWWEQTTKQQKRVYFLAYFLYFQKIELGLREHCAVSVSVFTLSVNFWIPEPNLMERGTYIMAPKCILTAYFINPFHQSVHLYVYPPIVDWQRLGENVTAAMYTHATIEELLDASFSLRYVSCQRKVDYKFFPELLVYI
jgi:hypothetical protein